MPAHIPQSLRWDSTFTVGIPMVKVESHPNAPEEVPVANGYVLSVDSKDKQPERFENSPRDPDASLDTSVYGAHNLSAQATSASWLHHC